MGDTYHLFKRWYSNKNGKKYYYWWFWYYDPVDGRQVRKPAGRACTNKRQAEDFIAGLPEIVSPSEIHTVKDVAENMFKPNSEWMKRKTEFSDGLKDSTRKAYDGNVQNHLLPQFGDRDIESIKANEIEDYLIELNRKPSTKNTIIDTWNTVFREAMRLEYLDKIPQIQRFSRNSSHYDILTDEELELLFPDDKEKLIETWTLDEDEDQRDPLMFGVMLLTAVTSGMRSGEVRAMHRDQLFLELKGLVINRQLDLQMNITDPKKGGPKDPRHRAVVIPDRTVRALNWWLSEYAPPNGMLFKYKGNPVDRELLLERFRRVLAKHKIVEIDKDCRIIPDENANKRNLAVHSLRYTYNTRMENVLSGKQLRQFMGHMNEEMTRHYSRPHWQKRLLEYQDLKGAIEEFWSKISS